MWLQSDYIKRLAFFLPLRRTLHFSHLAFLDVRLDVLLGNLDVAAVAGKRTPRRKSSQNPFGEETPRLRQRLSTCRAFDQSLPTCLAVDVTVFALEDWNDLEKLGLVVLKPMYQLPL